MLFDTWCNVCQKENEFRQGLANTFQADNTVLSRYGRKNGKIIVAFKNKFQKMKFLRSNPIECFNKILSLFFHLYIQCRVDGVE